MRARPPVLLIAFFFVVSVRADGTPPAAAIAAAHPLATEAGERILREGGNAFDAAVAVSAALAVVEPFSSGIGGGGFFLLHRAADGHEVMLDARERAPGAAHANMYLDAKGEPIPRASLDGPLAAAIPGLPAGLAHLAERYGRLSLARSLAPAIRLAREGFAVTPRYRRWAAWRREALIAWGGARVFLDGERVPALGYVVRQPELARTLEHLAAKGAAGFYRGEIARRLVEGVRAHGGIWALEDLAEYRVVEREPVRGTYRGARVVTAPLPSAGGIMLIEILGMLEPYDLVRMRRTERTHLVIEAMRRAYGDRARYLGDPDFLPQDAAAKLLDPARIARLGATIDRRRATPSDSLRALMPPERPRGRDTTHLSIIDTDGNRVAATLTINIPFGSAFVPAGTGVVLNNEMDDFASGPGIPNIYGLVGGAANAIAPGKRPLSSMTPTFIETPGAVAVLGTPGGSRITSMVMLAALDFLHSRGSVEEWVARARFHHQYLPDEVQHEPLAFSETEAAELRRRGHTLRELGRRYGNMQALVWDRATGRVEAASDPRGEGRASVFPLRRPAERQRQAEPAAVGR